MDCARKSLRENRGFKMSLVGFLKAGLLTQECQENNVDNKTYFSSSQKTYK